MIADLGQLEDLLHTSEAKGAGSGRARDFILIGRRHVRSNNSWMHNSPRLVKGPPGTPGASWCAAGTG